MVQSTLVCCNFDSGLCCGAWTCNLGATLSSVNKIAVDSLSAHKLGLESLWGDLVYAAQQ